MAVIISSVTACVDPGNRDPAQEIQSKIRKLTKIFTCKRGSNVSTVPFNFYQSLVAAYTGWHCFHNSPGYI